MRMNHLPLPLGGATGGTRRSSACSQPNSRRTSTCSVSSRRSSRASVFSRTVHKVLILSTTLPQAEKFHGILSSGSYPDVEFRYPASLGRTVPTLEALYADCCDVIREEEVDAVVSVQPGLELLHAALLREFSALRGPSIQSVFVSLHRHYLREVALDGFHAGSRTVNMEDWDRGSRQTILEDTRPPVIIREAYQWHDAFSKKVRNPRVLEKEDSAIRILLEDRRQYLADFLRDHLDTTRYALCLALCFTIEEYLKPGRRTGTVHLLEACVADGAVIPWAVCDIGIYKLKPVVVRHVTCPSQADDSAKYNLWAVFREVSQHILALGFDYQFLQMEILLRQDGVMRVLRVTPSLEPENTPLYRHVLYRGDSVMGQIDAALGRSCREPRLIPARCAIRAKIYSQAYNITLEEIVDLRAAKASLDLTLQTHHADHVIKQEDSDENGVHIADYKVLGDSFDGCLVTLKGVCSQVIHKW